MVCGSSKCICLLKEEGEIASTSGAVCRSKYICTFSEFPRLHGKKKLIFVWNDLTYSFSMPVKYWTVPMNVYFLFWFPIVFFDLQNDILLIWSGHYKWRRAAKFRNKIGTWMALKHWVIFIIPPCYDMEPRCLQSQPRTNLFSCHWTILTQIPMRFISFGWLYEFM